MTDSKDATLVRIVRDCAHAISGASTDYDPLPDLVGDARFVLLGEASHGAHDFYHQRARITKRLIEEKGLYGGCGGSRLAGRVSSQPLRARHDR